MSPIDEGEGAREARVQGEPKADDSLPHVVWSGMFSVCGVDLQCHVLSDGHRIIDRESLERFFSTVLESPSIDLAEAVDGLRSFASFLQGTH